MEEIIHINITGKKTDTHYVSGSFVRIWPHLLATVEWIIKNPIPGKQIIQYGIGMTIINNLAISVEGFIGDLIFEYIENSDELKKHYQVDIDKMTWNSKKELYNKLFLKKLEDYTAYECIATLINFRNNLAHGRTYTEFTSTDLSGGESSELESDNQNYQNIRQYLIKKGILKKSNVSSNVEIPWKLAALGHFVGNVKVFIENVLKENESKSKLGIETEFKLALSF